MFNKNNLVLILKLVLSFFIVYSSCLLLGAAVNIISKSYSLTYITYNLISISLAVITVYFIHRKNIRFAIIFIFFVLYLLLLFAFSFMFLSLAIAS